LNSDPDSVLAEWDIESAVQSESNAYTPAYLLYCISAIFFNLYLFHLLVELLFLMKFSTYLSRIPGSLFAQGSSFGYHCGFSGKAINE